LPSLRGPNALSAHVAGGISGWRSVFLRWSSSRVCLPKTHSLASYSPNGTVLCPPISSLQHWVTSTTTHCTTVKHSLHIAVDEVLRTHSFRIPPRQRYYCAKVMSPWKT
ncbi:unnamed protein product, partial [Ectocarpus sp. 12 AP-2014]